MPLGLIVIMIKTIVYENGAVKLLDQTKLPLERVMLDIPTAEMMWEAIKMLRIRGAPAIGVAAGFGLWLGIKDVPESVTRETFLAKLQATRDYLATSRPTAVNLFWALDRVVKVTRESTLQTVAELEQLVLDEAKSIQLDEQATAQAIGDYGAPLIANVSNVLTHCNAGSLATYGIGTALAPIYVAHQTGQAIHVYADETRPLLQGARLTVWELQQAGVPVTLITDNMSASVMKQGKVGAVIVGCDRVAANGDFANKIGTYGVAILAKEHGIPFYVAAPLSTIDFNTATGDDIPIEERDPNEVTHFGERQMAADETNVYNPAFDVTPANYVTAFITDKGVIYAPFKDNLSSLAERFALNR
jgi:methylthioribose-1-phosphate isomerase